MSVRDRKKEFTGHFPCGNLAGFSTSDGLWYNSFNPVIMRVVNQTGHSSNITNVIYRLKRTRHCRLTFRRSVGVNRTAKADCQTALAWLIMEESRTLNTVMSVQKIRSSL